MKQVNVGMESPTKQPNKERGRREERGMGEVERGRERKKRRRERKGKEKERKGEERRRIDRQTVNKKGNYIMTCLFQGFFSLHSKVPYSALQKTPKP